MPAPEVLGRCLGRATADASVPAWAQRIGVARVARVTDLDTCGVEVACAIRPAGLLLQVSNGKGATFARAKASAIAEALELQASENVDGRRMHWLAPEGDAFWGPETLGGFASPGGARAWAEAARLDRRGRVFVPASHVWCPASGSVSVGLRTAPWTSNGLAAHPDRGRALWHGLLEVLEREALCRTLPEGWTPAHLRRRAVRFEHPRAGGLRARGVRVHCVDATPRGWPVAAAAVLVADPATRAPSLAAGYACRRSGAEAAEAAFLEACQSRLTEIHGAREDVEQASVEVPEWVLDAPEPRRSVTTLPSWHGGIPALLRALGFAAAAVELTPAGVPWHVVRVFVPGCRFSGLLG